MGHNWKIKMKIKPKFQKIKYNQNQMNPRILNPKMKMKNPIKILKWMIQMKILKRKKKRNHKKLKKHIKNK